MTTRRAAAALSLTVAFLLIYLPDVGHGFIRDDFMWIRVGRIQSAGDVIRILGTNTGFYRPVVSLTFGIDHWLFGLRPFPYALTNIGILFVCAWLIVRIGRLLGLDAWAAGAAAAVWMFNFHGVNMALLWISGRTALLLCLFSLLATLASLRQRWWVAAVWILLALLSKEEAVTLPPLLIAWAWFGVTTPSARPSLMSVVARAWPVFIPVALYAILRLNSGAFGPGNAPPYYQFTFAPAAVARNAFEYLDRSTTFAAMVSLIAIVITRTRPRWTTNDARVAMLCLMWTVVGFAITLFLPLRSSLYALTPAVGPALMTGLLLQRLEATAPSRMRLTASVLLVLPFLLLPLYWQRNQRWVEPADMAAQLVQDLRALAPLIREGGHVVALDTADARLDSAFNSLLADSVTLYAGKNIAAEIVPASDEALWRHARDADRWRLQSDGHLTVITGRD